MIRRSHGLVFCSLFLFQIVPFARSQDLSGSATDQYIITLKEGILDDDVMRTHRIAVRHHYVHALHGMSGRIPAGKLQALRNDPRVESVIPDRIVSAIAKGVPVGGTGGGQVVPAGVARVGAAPGQVSFTGSGIGVAVVDTGLDLNHSDLQPFGSSFFTVYGTTAQDDNGHGTHVGGIIAARNNAIGVVGVAPNATLYPVKVLDSTGNGFDSDVLAGLEWIASHANSVTPPIRVVNLSLGRPFDTDETIDNSPMRPVIRILLKMGLTVVVAAGNDCTLEASQQVPAGYPEVIAVASTTATVGTVQCKRVPRGIPADTASYFTSDGAYNTATGIGVSISAPGEECENVITGCYISTLGILSTKLGGGTTRLSGTSMAAPHVAGVVALLYQQTPSLHAAQMRAKLRGGAVNPNGPLDSPTVCYTFDGEREGIVSAPGALAQP